MKIREALLKDAEEIIDIYRPYVLETAITFEYEVPAVEEMEKRIREREGEKAVEDWKSVLASGSTLTPLELAKKAGVDISTSAPLLDTIETIGGYITSLEEIFG